MVARRSSEWWRGERDGFAAANEMKSFGRPEVERAARVLRSQSHRVGDYHRGYLAGYDRGALGDLNTARLERDILEVLDGQER